MIPNLQIPNWDTTQPDGVFSVNAVDTPNGLNRYDSDTLHTLAAEDFDAPIHLFSSDHFRMFQFKIRNCTRARSHDWTECPYAHPGEKARRRDPRKYHYSSTACPEYRKGNCNRGDTCQFAHGVFECWLHPSRYRTQICKDGIGCRRRVCFFAHTMDQLRVLTRGSSDSFVISSPTSVLNADSPPPSPGYGAVSFGVREIMTSMRNVHIEDGPYSGSVQTGPVFGSPGGRFLSPAHRDEDPILERVESGRDIRARIYARISRENSIGRSNSTHSGPLPDIGWVSELVTHP